MAASSDTALLRPLGAQIAELEHRAIAAAMVVGADAAHVEEWFAETIKYMTERFPELSEQQITELRTLGLRFAQPPKARAETDAASAA